MIERAGLVATTDIDFRSRHLTFRRTELGLIRRFGRRLDPEPNLGRIFVVASTPIKFMGDYI